MMAIISIMLMLLISGISFSLVVNRYRIQTSEEKILRAYQIADSGINDEIFIILNALYHNPTIIPPIVPPLKVNEPFNGGSYTVKSVTFGAGNTSVIVRCEGEYLGVKRTLTEQYAIPIDRSP